MLPLKTCWRCLQRHISTSLLEPVERYKLFTGVEKYKGSVNYGSQGYLYYDAIFIMQP